jgi:UDP:flavonoid glycosyltransferase YjiC (YdhE family)
MGKVVLHAMAHRGDVFPYVPIASELSRRGHDVTFVVPREFHAAFADEPFTCVHSGTDFGPAALDEHGAYLKRWGMKLGGALTLRLYFGKFTIPHLPALYGAIHEALDGADLYLAHPAASVVGAMAAEKRGVPCMVGDLFPMLLPTGAHPPAGMPDLGPRANRKLWDLGASSFTEKVAGSSGLRTFRRSLGLADDDWNMLDARLSELSTVGLVSPHYIDHDDEWPEGYRLVGFTHWEGPGAGHLDDDVVDWLDADEPPVVVTLGTSGASSRPEVFEHAAAQLDRAGVRGIFLASNDANVERLRAVGPPHLVRRFVPLGPLLARARAVVQSGAHGTNALVLQAGLPSVVVPCLFDQLWHAQRQEVVGTGVMARKDRHLPAAVDRLLSDDGLAERAAAMGELLRAEDGTAAACDEAERLLAA